LNRKKLIQKLNPAVDTKFLVLSAGLMWCGVGIMLISLAVSWLSHYQGSGKIVLYSAGFLAAMPIHHFGFLRLADKNLRRLLPLEGKRCLFSFISWKSYLIIFIMVLLGITLRHSSMPKQYLSILYNGIGLGLFLSGLRYMRNAIAMMTGHNQQKTNQ
jgi:hypothetical protein